MEIFDKVVHGNSSYLEDHEFETIFRTGVYVGLFDEENYGEHCRRNSVYLFLELVNSIREGKLK